MRILSLFAPFPLLLAAAPAPPLAPGLWEETLVFALDSVNGSPDLGAQMQGMMPKPAPRRACYTAANLADPRAILMDAGDQACRFTRFEMSGGRLVAAGDCAAGTGQTMRVEGSGTYSASGYDFTFAGTGHAGTVDMAFRGRDSGRRVGMCPAG